MNSKFRIYRGNQQKAEYKDYEIEVQEGMVVLDAVHKIQAELEPDLAVRWNCKAGKCGSCSAEVNGKPVLMCMTRLSSLPEGPVQIGPMKAFPLIKDLVTDVSWNYEQNKKITPFTPSKDTVWKMQQRDVERAQEFRKCIECFLCQDVCHVLRTHKKHDQFFGPRFFVRTASLDMHPLDTVNRTELLKEKGGIGLCNITKCCTEVCPEDINITDNAIIPMKERVADQYYDPIKTFWGKLFKKNVK
ncbi:MAG: succinate dehydrogenase/fumarate reductase iron-sulfur subunit [bacterium]|nr:succinate dehydrogenase/fumarate reductase iron-sulfur subunit [bacterium]